MMPQIVKKRSVKAGLPPGSLVYIGDKKAEKGRISVIDYDESHFSETIHTDITECFAFKNKDTVTWIDLDLVHRVDLVTKLGECHDLHPLVLEDILNTDQRPKLEDYGEYLYIVLRNLSSNGHYGGIASEQISIIVGSNYVISFKEREGDFFNGVRDRLRTGKGRIRKSGPDYLVYSLIDAVVDHYFFVLETLGERIEALEDKVVAGPKPEVLRSIHTLKREMIFLRRSVWPLREVISALERGDSPLVTESTAVYLRDVYDHTIQVMDTVETFRDILSGMLDIYLSSASNRLNEVMKVLTMIATIFIPLTFIVGIYGMNFKYMPELEWRWGYPAVMFFMFIIGICMIGYFKKKKWI